MVGDYNVLLLVVSLVYADAVYHASYVATTLRVCEQVTIKSHPGTCLDVLQWSNITTGGIRERFFVNGTRKFGGKGACNYYKIQSALVCEKNATDFLYTSSQAATRERDLPEPTYASQPRVRRQSDSAPRFIPLNEYRSERFVWLQPIISNYGYTAYALAGGATWYSGTEYVKLQQFESADYLLEIPGIVSTGPHYTDTEQGLDINSRTILKWSERDAAWMVWDMRLLAPSHCYNSVDCKLRCPGTYADVPGFIYTVTPF